ncbi:uncharacterized protein [Watersipora subatra]|uniref:uncharacterized protein n=1 Tax=Watersipora subatra TaxID=2589382 RepID=UPI00355BB91A
MAGSGVSFEEDYNIIKKEWLERQKKYKNMRNAKSKLPPMSIEPFSGERQRLPFQMSDADRALRQQWLRDQFLVDSEPRYIPELRPRNIFRRAFGYPWDVLTKSLSSSMGVERLRNFRYLAPKIGMFFVAIAFVGNYIKHNQISWEKVGGANIFTTKLAIYPGEPLPENPIADYHEKSRGQFYDAGFSKRKVFQN